MKVLPRRAASTRYQTCAAPNPWKSHTACQPPEKPGEHLLRSPQLGGSRGAWKGRPRRVLAARSGAPRKSAGARLPNPLQMRQRPLEETPAGEASPDENMPHAVAGGALLTRGAGARGAAGREGPRSRRSQNPRALIRFPGSVEEEVRFLRQARAFPQIRKKAPMRNLDPVLQEIKRKSNICTSENLHLFLERREAD